MVQTESWTALWLVEINVCVLNNSVCSAYSLHTSPSRSPCRRRHTSICVVSVLFMQVFMCVHACVPQLKDYGFNNESVVIVALSRIDIDVKCSCSKCS